MCIVTYFPLKNGFLFTSNRDENKFRKAIPPERYSQNGKTLVYPKDLEKGGSWMAVNLQHENLGCLLNGFKKENADFNGKSRGLLVIDALKEKDPSGNFKKVHLSGMAPFAFIHLQFSNTSILTKYTWDGEHLQSENLDSNTAHIWASTSLYDYKTSQEIVTSFQHFCNKKSPKGAKEVLEYHTNELNTYLAQSSVSYNKEKVKTVSTSLFSMVENEREWVYVDILNNKSKTTLKF